MFFEIVIRSVSFEALLLSLILTIVSDLNLACNGWHLPKSTFRFFLTPINQVKSGDMYSLRVTRFYRFTLILAWQPQTMHSMR